MKQIEASEFKENIFETIGKEWMLVTGGTKEDFNMMTASWGGIGWLWNKPVAFIFVRPERYTYEFLKKNRKLSLSFLGKEEEARKIYSFCGSKSGRELDKVKETGLKPVFTETDGIGAPPPCPVAAGTKLFLQAGQSTLFPRNAGFSRKRCEHDGHTTSKNG